MKAAMKVLAGAAAGAVRATIPPLQEVADRGAEAAGIDTRGGNEAETPDEKGAPA